MKTTALFSLPLLLLFFAPAGADPYRWQIAGTFNHTDYGTYSEDNSGLFAATYYLRPVDDDLGPRKIAPFLNRSSRISVSALRTEHESDFLTFLPDPGVASIYSLQASSRSYALAGQKVWRESGWIAGGNLVVMDPPESFFYGPDTHAYGIVGGKYIAQSTMITASFGTSHADTTTVITGLAPGQLFYGLAYQPQFPYELRSSSDTESAAVAVMHVGGSGNWRYAISAKAETVRRESRSQSGPVAGSNPPANVSVFQLNLRHKHFDIKAEWFPTDRLGIHLAYETQKDTTTDYRVELGTHWFFRPRTAVEFVIARVEHVFSGSISEPDTAQVRFLGRF